MAYAKFFNPGTEVAPSREAQGPTQAVALQPAIGDRRDGQVYVYTPNIVLAVNVALATGRPLLVSGNPGCGKSSLAPSVAAWMGWRYYEEVVTARTQARDLLWRFDVVRRLSDAQTKQGLKRDEAYVEPGVLWWAFDREGARRRGVPDDEPVPEAVEPGVPRDHDRAVVLVDEIDKADPDVPNSLLVALGSLRFKVEETQRVVAAKESSLPLVVITTNDERELPRAFLRRCISLAIPDPNEDRLVRIAADHFPGGSTRLHRRIASEVVSLGNNVDGLPPPSTAEYLDAVRAADVLKLRPSDREWEVIVRATLRKRVTVEENQR